MRYEVISKRDCIPDSSVVLKHYCVCLHLITQLKFRIAILGIKNILKYIKIENSYLKLYNILIK